MKWIFALILISTIFKHPNYTIRKNCVDVCARHGREVVEICLSEKGALAKKRLGNTGVQNTFFKNFCSILFSCRNHSRKSQYLIYMRWRLSYSASVMRLHQYFPIFFWLFLGTTALHKSMIRRMNNFTNAWTLLCFLVKCIIYLFLGVNYRNPKWLHTPSEI